VNEKTKPATPRARAARKPGSCGGTERERAIRALVEKVRTARAAEQRLLAAARRRSDQLRAQRAAAVAGMREQGLTRAGIAVLTGLTFGEITAAVKAARADPSRTAPEVTDQARPRPWPGPRPRGTAVRRHGQVGPGG
jgi:hypothetical protein